MNPTSLNNKRILFFQQRGWGRRIGHFLAKKLQKEGARVAALTFKKETHEFVLNQKEVKYDLVINNDAVMENPVKFLAGEDFSFEEICKDLGVDSLWPFIYTLRNHVRNYGDKYYYSFRQNVPDEEIIAYVKGVYKYLKQIFESFKPDIILSPNFADITHIMCNLFADKYGAAMIAPTDCKIRGVNIFIHGYQEDRGSFCDRIDELNSRREDSTNLQRARKYIEEFRTKFINPEYTDRLSRKLPFWKRLRRNLVPLKQIFNWYTKEQTNYLSNLGFTIDYRSPRIILRDFLGYRKYRKFMDNFTYYPFEKLRKFVYFPLQFQPESTIDVQAPHFSNQIETARLVAMSLPGDYTLAVKEHPAMVGFRPPSYIEKIARTANIKLIDYRISSETVLKKADLIVSPSSTTIAEAVFYRKPAIQLGNLGTTLKLPNVFKHSEMPSLPKKIKEVLRENLHTPEYERRLLNYVAAVYDTGFVFNYWGLWERGEKADMEELWQIYKSELERVFSKKL